jgi:hypothetical protein
MADLGSLLGAAGVGGVIGKAIVSLELSTAKYQAELKAAQGETAASTSAMGSGFSKFSGFAQAAMLGVGAAVVVGIGKSISAASDLNEQLNKTRVVFEDSADTVIAFSETTAESLGVSETAALTAAGSFGQILDAAGLAESATAKMSISLVTLASDLASFNNIDPTEALDKLQSGLAGQARPLREVGVFLSAARVEAEAYRSGIAKVGEELTDAQKIQARYNIIMDDTAKAQGDFARTVGESLPNQIRVLRAELEDAAAKIGTALLPAVQGLVETLAGLVPLLEKVAFAMQFLPIVQVGEDFDGAGSRLSRFADGLLDTIPILGHFVDLSGDGSDAVNAFGEEIGQGGKGLGNFRGQAFQASLAVGELGKDAKKTTIEFADLTLSLSETAEQTKITGREFLHATNVMEREARQLDTALLAISKEDWVNPKYVAFLSEQGPEWIIGFSKLTEEQQHIAQQAWRDSTRELDNARESQDKMIGALDKLDKSTTKHTVEIEYRYVGFDPSKPGMASSSSNQQR